MTTRVPGAQEWLRLPEHDQHVVETSAESQGNAELTGKDCPTICPTSEELARRYEVWLTESGGGKRTIKFDFGKMGESARMSLFGHMGSMYEFYGTWSVGDPSPGPLSAGSDDRAHMVCYMRKVGSGVRAYMRAETINALMRLGYATEVPQ